MTHSNAPENLYTFWDEKDEKLDPKWFWFWLCQYYCWSIINNDEDELGCLRKHFWVFGTLPKNVLRIEFLCLVFIDCCFRLVFSIKYQLINMIETGSNQTQFWNHISYTNACGCFSFSRIANILPSIDRIKLSWSNYNYYFGSLRTEKKFSSAKLVILNLAKWTFNTPLEPK